MEKKKGALIVVSLLCFSITNVLVSNVQSMDTNEAVIFSNNHIAEMKSTPTEEPFKKIEMINQPNTIEQSEILSQPILGDDEVFGLWLHIIYNEHEILKKVDIDPWWIRGKLSDPGYRTPITFNIDDDPEDDIEIGFGFFQYGIDIGDEDHSAWATTLDFAQINNQLDDQLGYFEVWQEFHVNLALIKNAGLDLSSHSTEIPNTNPSPHIRNTRLSSIIDHFTKQISRQREKNIFTGLLL